MVAVIEMGKKKGQDDAEIQPQDVGAKKKKPEPNVKLSPIFHIRLKLIAVSKKKDMGELIENVMSTFMVREWKALTGRDWSDPE